MTAIELVLRLTLQQQLRGRDVALGRQNERSTQRPASTPAPMLSFLVKLLCVRSKGSRAVHPSVRRWSLPRCVPEATPGLAMLRNITAAQAISSCVRGFWSRRRRSRWEIWPLEELVGQAAARAPR
jgi:hypothetical protein